MPFRNPMHPYNRESVLRIDPNQNGVYGIRGGLVCLNSAARFDKWNRAAVR